jgi:hypothetical protein
VVAGALARGGFVEGMMLVIHPHAQAFASVPALAPAEMAVAAGITSLLSGANCNTMKHITYNTHLMGLKDFFWIFVKLPCVLLNKRT